MGSLPHDAQLFCQSPTLKDQVFYSHNTLQSPWPLPQQLPLPFSIDLDMNMELGDLDVQSNPATPEGGGAHEHSHSPSHFHNKSLSNSIGSSLDHSPRSFSEDVTQPPSQGQQQQGPQQQQGQPQYHPSRLAEQQRHYHSPTSSSYLVGSAQFHANTAQAQVHGPPLQRHHPPLALGVGTYGEHSLSQQQQAASSTGNNNNTFTENTAFLHQQQQQQHSGVLNGNRHGNGNHHPGNPPLYDFPFNGMDVPSSIHARDWNLMQTNGHGHAHGHTHAHAHGYPHLQGIPVLPQGTYMTPQLELYTVMSIDAQIQQYHDLNRTSSLSNSPLPNYLAGPNNTNTNTPYATGTTAPPPPPPPAAPPPPPPTGGAGGAPGHTRPPSQSTMSTPSLTENSPTLLPWSPSFEFGPIVTATTDTYQHQHQHHLQQYQAAPPLAHAAHAAHAAPPLALRDPLTPPKLPEAMPKPPKCNNTAHKEKSPTTKEKPAITTITTATTTTRGTRPPKPRHGSSGKTSISSVRSGDSPWPVPPTPVSPTAAIPLRVRVADLPRDKRTLFERAAGELWDAKEEAGHKALDRLDRAQVMLLEDLYALISSVQLRDQKEIPDDLVEPVLKTILLPKAESHRGSRGGAAGHLCLWAGCGKTIKRLDHSRNHIREHCKSKPHVCGGLGSRGCGQTFLRMDDLKRHQKSHCSVLRSGPGRRPRSIRGTRRDTDEEEEGRDSEDSTSLNGGDDDDYRPIHTTRAQHLPTVAPSPSSSASTTREIASRLRSQRQRAARYVLDDSTEESDSGSHERGVGVVVQVGRLQTSNVRRAIASPRVEENPPCGAEDDRVGEDAGFSEGKVGLQHTHGEL